MDNRSIVFSDFEISSGSISFHFNDSFDAGDSDENRLYFNLSDPIIPQTDLIAIAISTLCGEKYFSIHYELNVSPSVLKDISVFTGAKVTASENNNVFYRTKRYNITLNFSGGFDSLCTKCLMPDDVNLVSIDFGGRFSREREFYEKFGAHIMETNLVETPLIEDTWEFMGIASILYSDYLATAFNSFGTILEASENNLSDNPTGVNNISRPPFKMAGMENAPYVLGLTEVGTLLVLSHHAPELISPSLDSLAHPGEEKRYRKQVLAMIVSGKTKTDFNLNIVDHPPKPYFKFGESFAADFLSFYIIKNAGLEVASHTISEIPDEVVKLTNRLSLEFFEKINPKFIVNFPKPLLNGFMSKLEAAKIYQYSEKDWDEFIQVREILSQYYDLSISIL